MTAFRAFFTANENLNSFAIIHEITSLFDFKFLKKEKVNLI